MRSLRSLVPHVRSLLGLVLLCGASAASGESDAVESGAITERGAGRAAGMDVAAEPTAGKFFQVHNQKGYRSVISIAREAGVNWRWVERSDWNRDRYFDPRIRDNLRKNGGLSLNPKFAAHGAEKKPRSRSRGTGRSYPLLWIPAFEGDEPPNVSALDFPAEIMCPEPRARVQTRDGDADAGAARAEVTERGVVSCPSSLDDFAGCMPEPHPTDVVSWLDNPAIASVRSRKSGAGATLPTTLASGVKGAQRDALRAAHRALNANLAWWGCDAFGRNLMRRRGQRASRRPPAGYGANTERAVAMFQFHQVLGEGAGSGLVDFTTLSALDRVVLPARSSSRKPAGDFFDDLPDSLDDYLETVQRVARDVDLPVIHRNLTRHNPEFAKPIKIKKLEDFARLNIFGHFKKAKESIVSTADKGGKPPWLRELETVLEQSGAGSIERSLAFAIAMREAGGKNFRSKRGERIDTFGESGLDFLFRNRKKLVAQHLVPAVWIGKSEMTAGTRGRAAVIPKARLLAFTFARVGMADDTFVTTVAREFFGNQGELEARILARVEVDALSPLERKIWIAIAFGGPGGGTNLKKATPGGTGVLTLVKAFHDANIPLSSITDLPSVTEPIRDEELKKVLKPQSQEKTDAIRFLRRAVNFDRLNISTKTAIAAQAIEES